MRLLQWRIGNHKPRVRRQRSHRRRIRAERLESRQMLANVSWDFAFNEPSFPLGWEYGGVQFADEFPWVVKDGAINGRTRPPEDGGREDSWIETPTIRFEDPSEALILFEFQHDGPLGDRERIADCVVVTLQREGSSDDHPDCASGSQLEVATVLVVHAHPESDPKVDQVEETPIGADPNTGYRLRFRASDYDGEGSTAGVWIRNLTIEGVIAEADLSITVTPVSSTVNAGDSIDYNVRVANNGPVDAENVVVAENLASGLARTSTSCPGGAEPSCNLGTIRTGTWIDYSLTAVADGNLNGVVNSTFQANSEAISDQNNANNSRGVDTDVIPSENNEPIAADDTLTTNEDSELPILDVDLLFNDSDVDNDDLLILSYGEPAHGTLMDSGDGSLTYLPEPDFNGTDSFSYSISDGRGGTSAALVTINVTAVNDRPVAEPDRLVADEDTPRMFQQNRLLRNDGDVETAELTIASFSQPAHGELSQSPNGRFTYVPTPNFNGEDSFTYTIRDEGGETATATVTINVTPVNDQPIARPDELVTEEDVTRRFQPTDLLGNDDDVETDMLVIASFSQPAHGELSQSPNGRFTYVPSPNFNGRDSFTYMIRDQGGETATANVTINVTPVNDQPIARPDELVTEEDVTRRFQPTDLLGNDDDVETDMLVIASFSQPEHGELSQSPNGRFTYVPSPNFNGQDSFTYTIRDDAGETATATVTVSVTPVDDPIVAVPDQLVTDEDVTLIFQPTDLLDNDMNTDTAVLVIASFSQPTHGELSRSPDGQFTYVPKPDFNGEDSFTYIINDEGGAAGTVTILVAPVNDRPVARPDQFFTSDADMALTIELDDLLRNDDDVDGDILFIVSVHDNESQGIVTFDGDKVEYNPNGQFAGLGLDETAEDHFRYRISDGAGEFTSAVATVTIRGTAQIAGDSNFDGIFDSSDLVKVFQFGEYEDDELGNSTFEEGDWNGDGDFTSSDMIFVFQLGTFVSAAKPFA